jgi:protocatechuate 3,4-dioxygenase beta subunit
VGVRNVWVHMLETGRLAVTDGEGRFRFDRLSPGSYTVTARGPDGKETKAKLTVPGQGAELTLGAARAAAKS